MKAQGSGTNSAFPPPSRQPIGKLLFQNNCHKIVHTCGIQCYSNTCMHYIMIKSGYLTFLSPKCYHCFLLGTFKILSANISEIYNKSLTSYPAVLLNTRTLPSYLYVCTPSLAPLCSSPALVPSQPVITTMTPPLP